jgi:hypothetical protein
MAALVALRTQIRDAFLDVPYVDRETFLGSHTSAEEEVDEFLIAAQDRKWWEVSGGSLYDNRHILAYVSPVGFRYLLPAFMTNGLTARHDRPDVLDSILTMLEWPFQFEDVYRSRIELLDMEERVAVDSFLAEVECNYPDTGLRRKANRARARLSPYLRRADSQS